MQVIPSPSADFLRQVKTISYHFLWGARVDRIKWLVLAAPSKSGGTNLTDLEIMDKALKIAWVPRFSVSDAAWASVVQGAFTIDPEHLFRGNLHWKDFSKYIYVDWLQLFWQQVFQYWCDFNYSLVVKTLLENISSQGYWLNSCIKINGSVVYSPELFDKANSLKCFFKPGRLIKVREWNQEFSCTWSDLDFLKIIQAIPYSWVLSMLHTLDIQRYSREMYFSELVSLPNKHASHIYHTILSTKITQPSCISKWEHDLNNTEISDS